MSSSTSPPPIPDPRVTRSQLRSFLAKHDYATLQSADLVDEQLQESKGGDAKRRQDINLALLARYGHSLDFPDACRACRKLSPAAQPFLACSKCMAVVYCALSLSFVFL